MSKAPAFQWYPNDWLGDVELQSACSATRGIWANALSRMWFAKNRGELTGSEQLLIRLLNCEPSEFSVFLTDAETLGFCEISRDSHGNLTLRNRRMWREEKERKNARERQRAHYEKKKNNSDSHANLMPPSSSSSSSSNLKSKSISPDGESAPRKKTFKQWGEDEFQKEIDQANKDGLLLPEEVEDFLGYWMEPSASGRSRLSLEKTWDTRRRMQTALRVVFEAKRKRAGPATGQEGPRQTISDEDLKREQERLRKLRGQ